MPNTTRQEVTMTSTTQHTCTGTRGLSPAQLTDLCRACQERSSAQAYTPPLTVTPGVCHCGKFVPGHAPGLTARYATCTGDVPDTDTARAAAQAQAALAATPTTELLTTAYALTHRMDSISSRSSWAGSVRDSLTADLRAQRDLITAELLRRTGGQ